MHSKTILISIVFLMILGFLIPCGAWDERDIVIPVMDQNPIRDVAIDKDGNIFVLALKWNIDRPQIKSFTSDGTPRPEFNLSLPSFCCEPFPMKIVQGKDGFLYLLLPAKEGLRMGANLLMVRMDSFGMQDEKFGTNGSLEFPDQFRLKDFDVSADGRIWALNDRLELFTFETSGKCIRVRELKDIFPDTLMGGQLTHFYGLNLFSIKGDRLLLFGLMDILSANTGESEYYSALELEYDGRLSDHHEWEVPWFPKGSKHGSFYAPMKGKCIISWDDTFGSVLGNPESIRGEPDQRSISVADWSMNDDFHFYNVQPLGLPKEIYLDYDLNLAFFIRNESKTLVFFPMDRTKDLLVQEYDSDGNPVRKFSLDVYN